MTTTSIAFVFDASACSGCKACQVACKDKNQLPLGVLWRRVYEVTGGGWKQQGAAWTNTLFAYNLSLSCNHCEHPKCAGVCPVDAYTVREDGIVILDSSKCIGCGYCAWACPYGAPQYDRAAGRMTKCDLCYDNLDLGLPPACVAACPLRVLDYAEVDDGAAPAGRIALWDTPAESHPYPMPPDSRTGPHLAIKPHAAMTSREVKRTANLEEVRPQRRTGWEEAPLVAFTLLIQAAVGGFWATLWLVRDAALQVMPLLLVGLLIGAGMMASFAHLGTKRNAWRVLNHLRKSWLSREILFTLLFGAGWLVTFGSVLLHAESAFLAALTAVIGLILLYCMPRVYRLRSVPSWNTWRTDARFTVSAALLGTLAMLPALIWQHVPAGQWSEAGTFVVVLLLAEAAVAAGQSLPRGRRRLQLGLIAAAMVACDAVFLLPGWLNVWSSVALLLLVLVEQAVGRWMFYEAREGGF